MEGIVNMKRDYLKEFDKKGFLSCFELTQEEFRTKLLELQETLCIMIPKDEGAHRIDEVIVFLEKTAREKGVERNPEFRKGMQALRQINKEIAISMAGKNGEERVARTLEHISRPNYKFRNVYVSDGELETELDDVILTESGFIILEVKNVKTDITISENGRILYANEACYHDISICEKMQIKRDLLEHELKRELKNRCLDIPVWIDSLIVFSAPKGVYLRIRDLCRKEKNCYRGKLPYIIDEYSNKYTYTDEEMRDLKSVMEEMKSSNKRFFTSLDFNDLCEKISAALSICLGESATVIDEVVVSNKSIYEEIHPKKATPLSLRPQEKRRFRQAGITIAGLVAGAVLAVRGMLASRMAYRRT